MSFGYSPRCMQMRTWHVPVADINGVGRIVPPKKWRRLCFMAHGYDAIRLWMEAPLDIRKRYLMSSINLNGLLTQVLPSAGGVI